MALLRRIAFKVETVNKVHLLCAIELMVPIKKRAFPELIKFDRREQRGLLDKI